MPSLSQTVQRWCGQAVLSDLPSSRRWSYLYFSLALLAALGSQNFLTPVKQAVFLDVVGAEQEPVAKTFAMVVLVPCLILYSMVVSHVGSPEKLVAMVCACYVGILLVICAALLVAGGQPQAWVAWALYYAAETKGVIIMPMLWSAIAEVSTPGLAKKAYPIMFFVVQLGGILGSLVAVNVDSLGGEVNLLLIQILCLFWLGFFAWKACRHADNAVNEETPLLQSQVFPQAQAAEAGRAGPPSGQPPWPSPVKAPVEATKEAWQTGLQEIYKGFEGLWLLLSRPYVFMAFWVSYANLMPRTMLDYQNQVLAVSIFTSRNQQIAYFGQVNLLINSGTAVLTLLGTRPIVEYFGVGPCLLALPVGTFMGVVALGSDYTLAMSTVSLVCVCILAYGLNSPCKEMLYVRTSREIKYKAKSWSEMYGNQAMKLLGAQMNMWVNREQASCGVSCFNIPATIVVSSAWVALWLGVAVRLGLEHRRLEADDAYVS